MIRFMFEIFHNTGGKSKAEVHTLFSKHWVSGNHIAKFAGLPQANYFLIFI